MKMPRLSECAAILALMVAMVGCSAETPTQATDIHDDMIASLVAGSAGYESTGLAATMNDLITVMHGGTVRESIGAMPASSATASSSMRSSSVVVTRSDSAVDPSTRRVLLGLSCRRGEGDVVSEWQVRYMVDPAASTAARADAGRAAAGIAAPRRAEGTIDGTYRTSALAARGIGNVTMQYHHPDGDTGAVTSGTYMWRGSLMPADGRTSGFDDVTITFTWSDLRADVAPGGFGERIVGRCDVNVAFNGADGAIARNGTLTFAGGGDAVLAIGSLRYLINVREGTCTRRF